jgi:hypothetical protein
MIPLESDTSVHMPKSPTSLPSPALPVHDGYVLDTQQMVERANALGYRLSVPHAHRMRWLGTGPRFKKIGSRYFYHPQRTDEWVAAQASPDVNSLNELGAANAA